jgi:hypothetical protein
MSGVRVLALALSLLSRGAIQAANFTAGSQTATQYGVHEIVLSGNDRAGNPFEAACAVRFTPPSGEGSAIEVNAFYDGGGLWRARVYVSEVGRWRWRSRSANHPELDNQSGALAGADSRLRGMLRRHARNPKHWVTDDGKWFLNLHDTACFLFNASMSQGQRYVEDDWATYGHLEGLFEVGADWIRDFDSAKAPVFLGEDRYEQDRRRTDAPLSSEPRLRRRQLSGREVQATGGETARARPVRAGGWLEFVSPWKGVDVVLHLWSEGEQL